MKYSVELFRNEMAILESNKKDDQGEVFRTDFVTGGACFSFAKAYIISNYWSLNVLRDVRANFRALKEEAKRYGSGRQRHRLTWRKLGLRFVFCPGADVRRVIKQFEKLLRDIEPLLELGKIISKQLERMPLNHPISTKLFTPMSVIDGMPVKQWLQCRERAALDIDPATAKIARSDGWIVDPYGVYPEVPERYSHWVEHHFVCSPDSNVWVWFDDLPKTTSRALNKRMDTEEAEAKSRKKSDDEDYDEDYYEI
jgi:hypothetical protein